MALNAGTVQAFATLDDKGFTSGMSNMKKQGDKFAKSMATNFTQIGKSLTTSLTLPLGLAGGAMIKLASDFETSLSLIEGLVGVAAKEVDMMRDSVLSLSGTTSKAPQELADALFFVTSAGLRGADAMDVLEKSAKASAAGLGETKSIADLLTSAINAYGKENLTSAQATDILTAAVREGKLEAQSLAPVMGRLLPMATELGVGFDEVSGFLAAMSRTGLDAATSSTALRGIMMKLVKPTEMAKKQLAEYGLSANDLRKQVKEKGLLSVLTTLSTTFKGNEEAMSRVFEDVEGLVGVLNILGQDADVVSGIMDGVTNSVGDMDKAFDVASKTAEFKFNSALTSLKSAGIELGSIMLPIVASIAESVASLGQKFSSLSDFSKKLGLSIAGIAFVAGPTLLFLGSLAKAYLSLQLALPKLIIAVQSLNLTMLANPYVAVGVAVAALAIKFNNVRVEANKLKKEIQEIANLEFKVSSLQAVNDTIDKVSENIEKIKKTGRDRVGLIGGNTAGEIKELKSLGQQLDILKQQRSNIVFGGFANELEAESKQANDLSQSVNRVSESISHLRTKTEKPVDIIIGGNWTDLFDIAKNADMDLNLPEKIAPQGSMARLQQDLAKLQESLAFTADPEKFKSLQTQIETLEQTLHGMTAIPDKIAPEGSMAKLKEDLAALQLQLEYTADPVKFAILKEQIEATQGALNNMQGDAVKGTNAMAGLANSIGSIFERAALQGENLSQVLKGILKQLAARAFVTGIGALLSGGASLGTDGFLKTMFGGMFHSGGVVQGSGDRMIRAKGGEMVLTKSQQKALSMGMTAPSGGGMSQGQIERAFSNALSRHIRGVSDRQIFEMSEKGRYN